MGDPKRTKKKYYGPSHPWQKQRIEEEKEIIKKYGLKNKSEIWKMMSMLRSYRQQAKKLTSLRTVQAEKEKYLFLKKLAKEGLATENGKLDAVLTLKLQDLLEKRLQTVVVKRGLARTMSQARQFIVHRHIKVGKTVVTSPSYFVLPQEEQGVAFSELSLLQNSDHPERNLAKPVMQVQKKEEVKSEAS